MNILLNLHNSFRDRIWVENIVQQPSPRRWVRNMLVMFYLLPEINFLFHSFLQINISAVPTLYQLRIALGITSGKGFSPGEEGENKHDHYNNE